MSDFPPGFLWGAATSAYQIEGSPLADGAGPSHWHRFTHQPDSGIPFGQTGDRACDHYRRWREDIALMRDLGLTAYRFSISWSRVLPAGAGRPNPPGLDFYGRLVDGLLEAGIKPMPTLYHWDLPQALEDLGGWLDPSTADRFADYAGLMCGQLGDRVTDWTTLNEPWVVADQGYLHGAHAPGHRDLGELPRVSHNLLRAHGLGVRACRAAGAERVGLVVNIEPKYPASERPEDRDATRRADAYMNRQYLDPVFLGRYPAELEEIFGTAWPSFPAEDFAVIGTPIDFLGINYYSRSVTRCDPAGPLGGWSAVADPSRPHTEMGWEVFPEGLAATLLRIRDLYGPIPLLVTENGAAFPDPEVSPQELQDTRRVDFLRDHLRAVRRAVAAGADVRGYFVWSLLDNFEWAFGYGKRFGIVHVDFGTQRRTPKASARFYSTVVRSGGAALG